LDLLPADIEILAGERGSPRVAIAGADALDVVPIASLAHAQGEAVALVALAARGADVGIGIDLEHMRPLPPGFAEAALTPEEHRLLEPLLGVVADEWLLRCWCAKEAAGKALGSGLAPAPAVVAVDPDSEQIAVHAGDRRLRAHTRRDGDAIVATVLWLGEGGEPR
jgi:phosphopantetheinyl transferase